MQRVTITDADLLDLFGDDPPALKLMLAVKVLARGRSALVVNDRTLWRRLGWNERHLRRVKARVRDAGVPIRPRTGRHGGPLACKWVLDRRQVPLLRGAQVQELVAHQATYIQVENPSSTDLPSVGQVEEGSRPPPAGLQASATAAAVPPQAGQHPPEFDPASEALLAELRELVRANTGNDEEPRVRIRDACRRLARRRPDAAAVVHLLGVYLTTELEQEVAHGP